MTALSIIRTACARIGIPQPGGVVGFDDPQLIQLLALANEDGEELAARYNWQALTREATFTTIATEIQGSMADIAPGFKFVLNDTIWNRSLQRPVYGPLSSQQWQQAKAWVSPGPYNSFKIEGGNIRFIPEPAAGQSCYFQYVTSNWTEQGNPEFLDDTDTALLDENLLKKGVVWRWKKSKGLIWQPDHEEYERAVKDAIARDGTKPALNLNSNPFSTGATWPWPITNIGL